MDQTALLNELEPVADQLLNKHLASAKEWFPHELVPWSRGRDFEPGEVWTEDEAPMDPAVRSSLFVNLLTEDNLPYYFRTIETLFGADSAWGTWVRRWTGPACTRSRAARCPTSTSSPTASFTSRSMRWPRASPTTTRASSSPTR